MTALQGPPESAFHLHATEPFNFGLTAFLQGSLDLQSPFSGDMTFPAELIPAHHASPSKPDSSHPGRFQSLASAVSQQSELTPQQSGMHNPLMPLQTPPVQQGLPDPSQSASSSKSKLANLMQRFGQLKKSERKSEPGEERGVEGWGMGRGGTPEILTLGDDDDDDMVCMRSPSVSPLPRR